MDSLTTLRLTLKLQRWEIALVVLACLALTVAAAWLTIDMRSVLATCGTPEATKACDVVFAFQDTHGEAVGWVQALTGFVPVAVGLVLGIPIVAREIESRTALIAWPMAGSRARWLAWRALPTLAIGLVLVGVLGVAADQLARAYFPHTDIGFVQYEGRGLPLVMRTALIFAVAVVTGAVIGRVLPALLVGIGLSAVVIVALAIALPHWVPSVEIAGLEEDPGAYIGARLHTEIAYRVPDGGLVSAEVGEAMTEEAYAAAAPDEPDPQTLPQMVIFGVAADRYWEVVLREWAALGLASIGLLGMAALVLERRRAA